MSKQTSYAGWEAWSPKGEVARRAGGRRGYHAWRRQQAIFRRAEVIRLFTDLPHRRGVQVAIARELGWSKATISRDLCVLFGYGRAVALARPLLGYKRRRGRKQQRCGVVTKTERKSAT